MTIRDIIILGAGPSGLAAAIALSRLCPSSSTTSSSSSASPFSPSPAAASSPAPPLRITLVELRPELQPIGGTLNLTPLAMRYLDHLGAGDRVRAKGADLRHGLDYVAQRTGKRLGNFWGGMGGVRVARRVVVESLLETLLMEQEQREERGIKEGQEGDASVSGSVRLLWGKRVVDISEDRDGAVVLRFEDGGILRGDVLLGCDGINSAARRLWVEPDRKIIFTGRVLALGWLNGDSGSGSGKDGDSELPRITLVNGEPALRDTALFTAPKGVLLSTYYEPSRSKIHFAQVLYMDEPRNDNGDDARNAWKVVGDDRESLRRRIVEMNNTGRVHGLQEAISRCEEWDIYPVYILPPNGRWSRSKVLLLGDAAHAMVPAGESSGYAIEDALLLARIFEHREHRTLDQMFTDYERLRKPTVDRHYKSGIQTMHSGFKERSWMMVVVMEWVAWLYLLFKRWGQDDHFARDVRDLDLSG
ncbi:hypothetical protein BX600DRAFT_439136 [Xylariales sp. PMI_506]|nr:hypothetical protein BX600DRAFT_439136 [Xylariales sp. PMI_506]